MDGGQNRAAKLAETVLGHDDKNKAAHTDIANPDRDGGQWADSTGEKMKALAWMGKNDVRVSECFHFDDIVHRP